MQFLEASAEMTRWLRAHTPIRRKLPSVTLLGQTVTGHLLRLCKHVGISASSPLMAESSP